MMKKEHAILVVMLFFVQTSFAPFGARYCHTKRGVLVTLGQDMEVSVIPLVPKE
jgi:hypothetical protein